MAIQEGCQAVCGIHDCTEEPHSLRWVVTYVVSFQNHTNGGELIMPRTCLSMSLLLIIHLVFISPATCKSEHTHPNFIIIYADDMGYGDLGCYGAELIKTPHLDQMASQGMRFTSFYSCSPVCTPSRAGILTGRYPIRSGLNRVLFPYSTEGIGSGEVTLAQALKEGGYSTACIGKWHLGHLPEFLPTRHGFDAYFGIPYSNDMQNLQRGDPPLPLMRDETITEAPADQNTLTKRYTEEAVRFIDSHKDQPFFLYLPHTMVHVPLHVSKEFEGHSAGGLYGDAVEEVDWSVGQVLEAVKKNGLDENTLVVFASDNGPWLIKKEHGGSAGPLRNGKGTTFEGGIREPAIFRWPGTIPAGSTTDEGAITLDLFPTLLLLAGQELPKDRILDGKDIRGILTNTGPRADHRFFFFRGENLEAFRWDNWKLKRAFKGEIYCEPGDQHPVYLFDLEKDISEKTNLAEQNPAQVEQMEREMQIFEQSLAPIPPTKK